MADLSGIIHICFGGPWYCMDGWKFEMHHYFGPAILRNDGELRGGGYIPEKSRFWRAFEKWRKLTDEQKAQTEIGLRGRNVWYYVKTGERVK